jgi:hypothetical protein
MPLPWALAALTAYGVDHSNLVGKISALAYGEQQLEGERSTAAFILVFQFAGTI